MTEKYLLLFSIWYFLMISTVFCGKHNVSYQDLDNCKEYIADDGYGYEKYFKISDVRGNHSNDEQLVVHFYVIGAKDAHILLSPVETPSLTAHVYEIVLGAGGNTFSEIRKRRKSSPMTSSRRPGIMSLDILPVTIRIKLNGTIEVYVANEETPFLMANDRDLITIHYLSFSTWGSAVSKWFYDCEIDEIDNNNKLVEQISEDQTFYKDLFENYDSTKIPDNLTGINLYLEIDKLNYNPSKSLLQTRSIFTLNWYDPKLTWNSTEFNNKTEIFTAEANNFVWLPDIYLINGKSYKPHNPLPLNLGMKIKSNGLLSAKSASTILETWCIDTEIKNIRQWPYDELNCEILFGLKSELNTNLIPTFKILDDGFDQNHWHLTNLVISQKELEKSDIAETDYGYIAVRFQFTLKRNSEFYVKIFCTPLIATWAFMLLSFWTNNFIRASLCLIGVLINAVMLLIMVDYAPNSYVPLLVKYYQGSLVLCWLALVVFVINRYIEMQLNKTCRIEWIEQCVQNKIIRFIFGLKSDNNTYYNQLLNQEDKLAEFDLWGDVCLILDRLHFFIFSILLIFGAIIGI